MQSILSYETCIQLQARAEPRLEGFLSSRAAALLKPVFRNTGCSPLSPVGWQLLLPPSLLHVRPSHCVTDWVARTEPAPRTSSSAVQLRLTNPCTGFGEERIRRFGEVGRICDADRHRCEWCHRCASCLLLRWACPRASDSSLIASASSLRSCTLSSISSSSVRRTSARASSPPLPLALARSALPGQLLNAAQEALHSAGVHLLQAHDGVGQVRVVDEARRVGRVQQMQPLADLRVHVADALAQLAQHRLQLRRQPLLRRVLLLLVALVRLVLLLLAIRLLGLPAGLRLRRAVDGVLPLRLLDALDVPVRELVDGLDGMCAVGCALVAR